MLRVPLPAPVLWALTSFYLSLHCKLLPNALHSDADSYLGKINDHITLVLDGRANFRRAFFDIMDAVSAILSGALEYCWVCLCTIGFPPTCVSVPLRAQLVKTQEPTFRYDVGTLGTCATTGCFGVGARVLVEPETVVDVAAPLSQADAVPIDRRTVHCVLPTPRVEPGQPFQWGPMREGGLRKRRRGSRTSDLSSIVLRLGGFGSLFLFFDAQQGEVKVSSHIIPSMRMTRAQQEYHTGTAQTNQGTMPASASAQACVDLSTGFNEGARGLVNSNFQPFKMTLQTATQATIDSNPALVTATKGKGGSVRKRVPLACLNEGPPISLVGSATVKANHPLTPNPWAYVYRDCTIEGMLYALTRLSIPYRPQANLFVHHFIHYVHRPLMNSLPC
ncbi:hypothetical protein HETIRDRAFT_427281 [Heterobasidion irregulare TC 32-1]|uniref:Uncharacterized protein n=1 Tax=Heterobasidion irregulare (strain TC 32-1) TaxID=747525 RepID=W4K8N9_HETIT|nr:uncharacterized protein HETIRDRAFT_427281 [Heterobasidion irregulare TC 32-1]ETW82153.1 hypothetical protein HETIRDRAFT_427281 [Heterobasidion irregulare TC 32-1]